MCFSIPSKVLTIDAETLIAEVETMGQIRHVSVHLLAGMIQPGDFVLIQSGFAMSKIEPDAAEDSLALYRDIVTQMALGNT